MFLHSVGFQQQLGFFSYVHVNDELAGTDKKPIAMDVANLKNIADYRQNGRYLISADYRCISASYSPNMFSKLKYTFQLAEMVCHINYSSISVWPCSA